jgi:hypothetical protein
VLVVSKPVDTAIQGLSGHCGTSLTLPVVHVETVVWDTRFPTDDRYFQRYVLRDVTLRDCQRADGAPVDALWLEFATIKKDGEPRPRKQFGFPPRVSK